jgi:hypothetical protein
MEARALRAISAHTRMPLGQQTVCLVQMTDQIRRLRVPIFQTVRSSVVRAQVALTEAHAKHATPENSRTVLAMQHALGVVQEAMPHKMERDNARHVSQARFLQQ